MPMNYEKYSEKSYVVRGENLDDATKRKEFVKQLQGNGIWNTRLKGGPGLLVSINDHNKSLLEKTKDAEIHIDEEVVDRSSHHSKKDESDEEEHITVKKSPRRKERKGESSDSEEDRPRRKTNTPTTRGHSSRRHETSDESESEDDRRNSRRGTYNRHPDSKRSSRTSSGDTPSSSSKKYHRSRSPASSSDSEDSSEDERIQRTIRRKSDSVPTVEKEVVTGPVDSETEDIINLSRRFRGLQQRLDALEKKVSTK